MVPRGPSRFGTVRLGEIDGLVLTLLLPRYSQVWAAAGRCSIGRYSEAVEGLAGRPTPLSLGHAGDAQNALGEAKVVDESSGIEVGRELKIPHQRARIVRRGLTPIAQLMRGSAAQPPGHVIRWRRRTRSASDRAIVRQRSGPPATAILDPSRLGPVSGGA